MDACANCSSKRHYRSTPVLLQRGESRRPGTPLLSTQFFAGALVCLVMCIVFCQVRGEVVNWVCTPDGSLSVDDQESQSCAYTTITGEEDTLHLLMLLKYKERNSHAKNHGLSSRSSFRDQSFIYIPYTLKHNAKRAQDARTLQSSWMQ